MTALPDSPHGRTDIIIFTRFPEPGTTKTRLITELGSQKAADLQRRMTEKIVSVCADLPAFLGVQLAICFCGGSRVHMKDWLGAHLYRQQRGRDLGEKMQYAMQESFLCGAGQAILVGSDIPGIDAPLLSHAVEQVQRRKLVIGPTHDGGYYLIGFHKTHADRLYPAVFQDIPWSTKEAFTTTLANIGKTGFPLRVLQKLHDIDIPEDLQYARRLNLL